MIGEIVNNKKQFIKDELSSEISSMNESSVDLNRVIDKICSDAYK